LNVVKASILMSYIISFSGGEWNYYFTF